MSQVIQYLTERKQSEPGWRVRAASNDTPLENLAKAVLNPEFELDWGKLENGLYVVTSDDLRRAFRKNVYVNSKSWLEVLLEEVDHLLALGNESLVEKAFFSLDRFTYWPPNISVKTEFEFMAETIKKTIK